MAQFSICNGFVSGLEEWYGLPGSGDRYTFKLSEKNWKKEKLCFLTKIRRQISYVTSVIDEALQFVCELGFTF